MKALWIVAVVAGATSTLAGCAFGNRLSYGDVTTPVSYSGNRRVAVVTYDQRPYVRSGTKPAEFVGLVRSGFGIPYDVNTESGHPLAYDMTLAACRSLAAKGYSTVAVHVAATDPPAKVLAKLQATQGERALIVAVREWKTDTHIHTALVYDMTGKVLDQTGGVVGQTRVQGLEDLGGSAWNPLGHARRAVPLAFAAKLGQILNAPHIRAALASP